MHGKKKNIITARLAVFTVCLLIALCSFGCSGSSISEDSVHEELPAIDPQAGIDKSISVVLYYRLAHENYLVAITRSVAVTSGERAERAIARTLIEETPTLYGCSDSLFPSGTRLVDVTLDGGILYVTLSKDFLDNSLVNEARSSCEKLFENGELSETEYEKRLESDVADARSRMLEIRRLAVGSVVNSLAAYNGDIRIQFLVDTDGSGNGSRLTRDELGFEMSEAANSALLEPMRFSASIVATPSVVMQSALTHLVNGEYELAYPFFGSTASGVTKTPDYAQFLKDMKDTGGVAGFSIVSYSENMEEQSASVQVKLIAGGTVPRELQSIPLKLVSDGDVYFVSYDSLLRLLKGVQ